MRIWPLVKVPEGPAKVEGDLFIEEGRGVDALPAASGRMDDPGRGGDVLADATGTATEDDPGTGTDALAADQSILRARGTIGDHTFMTTGEGGTGGQDDYVDDARVGNANDAVDGSPLIAQFSNLSYTRTLTRLDAVAYFSLSLAAATPDTVKMQFEVPFENLARLLNPDFAKAQAGVPANWFEAINGPQQEWVANDGNPSRGCLRHFQDLLADTIETRQDSFTAPSADVNQCFLRIASKREATDTVAANSSKLVLRCVTDAVDVITLNVNPGAAWVDTASANQAAALNAHKNHTLRLEIRSTLTGTEVMDRKFDTVRIAVKRLAGDRAEVALTDLATFNAVNQKVNRLQYDGFEYAAAADSAAKLGWTEANGIGATTQVDDTQAKTGTKSLKLNAIVVVGEGRSAQASRVFTNLVTHGWGDFRVHFRKDVVAANGGTFILQLRDDALADGLESLFALRVEADGSVFFNDTDTGFNIDADTWYELTVSVRSPTAGGLTSLRADFALRRPDGFVVASSLDRSPANAPTTGINKFLVSLIPNGVDDNVWIDNVLLPDGWAGHKVNTALSPVLSMDEVSRRLRLYLRLTVDGVKDNPVFVNGLAVRAVG